MKKIIYTFILFIFMFITENVLAESFKETEFSDYYYINYNNNVIKIDSIKESDSGMPVFSINLDNKENKYDTKREIKGDKEEYINLIIYYGYYKNYSILNYAKTQILIYEYLYPDIIFNLYNSRNELISIENENILEKIEKHNLKPIFNNTYHEVKKENLLELHDTNFVISYFSVDNCEVNYEVCGDTITFFNNSLGLKPISLIKKDIVLKNKPTVYDKNYISLGYYEPIYAYLEILVKYTTLNIELENFDKESVYEVYDNKTNELLETISLNNETNVSIKIPECEETRVIEKSHNPKYHKNNQVYIFNTKENKENTIKYTSKKVLLEFDVYTCFYNTLDKYISSYTDTLVIVYDNHFNKVTEFQTDKNGFAHIKLNYDEYNFYLVNANLYLNFFVNSKNDIVLEIPTINSFIYKNKIKKVINKETNEDLYIAQINNLCLVKIGLRYSNYYLIDEFNNKVEFSITKDTQYITSSLYGTTTIIEPIKPDKPVEPAEPDKPDKPIKPDKPVDPIIPDEEIEPDIDEESILIPVPNTGLSIDTIVMYVKEKYII